MNDDFVCLGNIQKGLGPEEARRKFGIPANISFVLGLAQGYDAMDKTELAHSVQQGVYMAKTQYNIYIEEREVIKPKRRYRLFSLILIFILLIGMSVELTFWHWLILLFLIVLALLIVHRYKHFIQKIRKNLRQPQPS